MAQDEALTMEEYIDLQEEAVHKYPWKFDTCFFAQGVVRQPLYICLDCCITKPAAVCYSCAISCHSDHAIVEIGMKRNFLCQCGLDCFSSPCVLLDKSAEDAGVVQEKNRATIMPCALHNFDAKFCYCNSEYDESAVESGTFMLQCKLCEDWFHSRCIKNCPSDEDAFGEFFCKTCISNSKFLKANRKTLSYEQVNPILITSGCNFAEVELSPKSNAITNEEISDVENELYCNKWWTESVCKCDVCVESLSTDPIKTILLENEIEWSPEPEEATESEYESALNSLKNADRTMVMDGMYACKEFGEKLKAFLLPFARENRIVTKQDIEDFIANQKTENAH